MIKSRRRFIATASAGALTVLTAPSLFAQEKKSITVMMWGSTWSGVFQSLAEQFTKETGIGVQVQTEATSVEGLVKLQAMRANPTVDVWFTAESLADRAATDKSLFAPMPKAKMSNWNQTIPGATNDYFAASYYFPLGIVYRPDLVPGGVITSWSDLWSPAFAGKAALPAPSAYPGRMILTLALLNGGSIDNVAPGIRKIKEIKDKIGMFYTSDPQTRRALASGEIWAMVGPPSAMKTLSDQGVKVAMVSPKPTSIIFEGMMLVKGGKEDLAAQFVNHVISKEWQQVVTDTYNMGPINKNAVPGEKIRAGLPKPGDGVTFNEVTINERLSSWTDQFNNVIAS